MNKSTGKMAASQGGFSLLEMLVVVAILTIVAGIVTQAADSMQKLNFQQTQTVDLVQQARQFLDQITTDIHQCGYPTQKMFVPGQTDNNSIATGAINGNGNGGGLVYVDPGQIQFEGDLDGSGTVQEVFVQVVPNDGARPGTYGPCPCSLRRGIMTKESFLAGGGWPIAQPAFYTEIDNVLNTDVFSAFSYDGSQAMPGAFSYLDQASGELPNVHAINITVSLKSPYKKLNNNVPVVSFQTEARIANH
jgi:prepilin-type N-terminal cleavage/methylation domain-containing protein